MAADRDASADARALLLDEGNALRALVEDGEDEVDFGRLTELLDRYRAGLGQVLISRCPFTGTPVSWTVDTVGLDGWYWNVDDPIRPLADPVPPTWLAMGGAMRLTEPLTVSSFDAVPGPDLPYTVPRLLARDEVVAVLSQVPVGAHTGWAITYFATRRPRDVALENLWGTRRYETYDDAGHWRGWAEHQQRREDYDFDLGPWLASGKLRWIAPDDPTATVRTGALDCPYVGLEGSGRLQLVRDGAIITF